MISGNVYFACFFSVNVYPTCSNMAASTRHISGGAETYFAKKLAGNEKTVRDKAVKKLKIWISTRHSTSSGLVA